MEYPARIVNERALTLDKLIELSRQNLPDRMKIEPWNFVGHGVLVLQTDEQLDAYIAAYGTMHQAKCRAALQDFPFDDLPYNIEIVDWGCGQGIATMVLLETLRARGMIDRVKRITLIEPSTTAINRAECNISASTNNQNINIRTYNKYLPSTSGSSQELSPENLNFDSPATIHLFSNILDIVSIDIKKTASIIESSQGRHFVVCIGPMNGNYGRIDEFCMLLNAKNFFSHISDKKYACTPDTHYWYSCVTRGFVLDINAGSQLNTQVNLQEYVEDGAYDDYDRRALARNGDVSENFIDIYTGFISRITTRDKIFINPTIEGDAYDLFVIRDGYGALIIKIIEYDITNKNLNSGRIQNVPSEETDVIDRLISTILGYKKNIYNLYSKILLAQQIKNNRAFYLVKTAIFFTTATEEKARNFCRKATNKLSRSDLNCVAILGSDSFASGNIWDKVGLQYRSPLFSKEIVNELCSLISSNWHSYSDGNATVRLNSKQQSLSQSGAGKRQKIKGVAGSGKTQVLVSRAINVQLRTGGAVLILTYNITLVNYIKYRMAQTPADFLWSHFTYGTYYRFFTTQAKNTSLKIDLSSYTNLNFFEDVEERLPKYDAILVDEVQDYQTSWLRILQKYFLKDNGEFVVLGDAKQNIYGTPLDEEQMVTVPGISGRWNILNKCFRAGNNKLIDLSLAFQQTFMPELDTDDIEREPLLDDSVFMYKNIQEISYSDESLFYSCLTALSSVKSDIDNAVILAPTCAIIRNIDYLFRYHGIETSTMCETLEIYEYLRKKYLDKEDLLDRSIDKVRENKKHHFSMSSPGLKMSTVHSYKGWEAETVVFIIPRTSTDWNDGMPGNISNAQVVYTAITRASKNLIIINLGDSRYDNFFSNQAISDLMN